MEPKDSPIEKDKEDLLQTINRLQQGAVLRDITETQSVKFPGKDEHTTIVVLGASGDLAKKMTFPALFSLHCLNMLPENCHIVGFARSKLSTEEFQKKALEETKGEDDQVKSFAKLLFYVAGQYDSKQDFEKLNEEIEKWEKNLTGNRIFYLAIPPSVFTAAASSAAAIKSKTGWTRIVVEKPFGRDLKTSEELCSDLARFFDEQQIFRIDHYLGKEMVQNLMALRFANVIWDPVWNNNYISCVMIPFKEDFGTQGRGGYFENYGIIRDVMQNHMLQMLALVAMEPPVTLSPEDVRDEKVKVLRACDKIDTEEVVIGQYTADKEGKEKGYKEEEGVPKDSITATFSTAVLHINNRRWKGVPFILRCGKGLNEKKTEIRIQFKKNLFALFPESARNELVIRVNPDEAIYMKFNAKVPGLSEDLVETELDLTYKSRFETRIPGAYERLIYDIIRGDRNLFVRVDELQAAWNIFTPMLHHLEKNKVKPEEYSFGTRGPESSDRLLAKCGFEKGEGYQWPTTTLDNNLAPSKDSKSATK